MSKGLTELFQEMSDLTAPECAASCKAPRSCCDEMYCDLAAEYAASQGVTLTDTGHTTLRFMGPDGCTVAPHLRPLCTLHTCAIQGFGFKPGDNAWTHKYFTLRDKIEQAYARETHGQEEV